MISGSKIERYAPASAGLALALPVLVFRYPPMKDLPSHEAMVALLRYGRDAARYPSGLYTLNLGHPNQAFYALAWALSLVVTTDLACKIIVAASIVALPISAARLANHLGASPWTALVVAPLAVGWMFFWGLAANLMGLAALLALLPLLEHFCGAPTLRRALAASVGTVALYATHESTMLVYAGASLLFALGYSWSPRVTALRVSPFLTGTALMLGHVLLQRAVHTPMEQLVPLQFAPFLRKFWTVPAVLFGAHDPVELYGLFALSVLTLVSFAIARARSERRSEPSDGASTMRRGQDQVVSPLRRFRYELLAGACFVAYLIFPVTALHATLIYHRFLAPAFALLVIALAPRAPGAVLSRFTPFLASAIPVATLAVVVPVFAQSSASARDLEEVTSPIESGSAILELNLSRPTNAVYSPYTVSERVMVTHGGRMLHSFADVPTSPVVMDPRYQWPEPFFRILRDPLALIPEHDFTRFRYLLVRLSEEAQARALARALLPEARVVASAGWWLLFESTSNVCPLTSPDIPLPNPRPPSLAERLTRRGSSQ